MAKRTLENCSLIKKMGGYPEQTETECLGFGRSEIDDEPCEICKKCKLYMGYYEDEDAKAYNQGLEVAMEIIKDYCEVNDSANSD